MPLIVAVWGSWSLVGAAPPTSDSASPAPRRFITPNAFEGSDVERINQAIEAAAGTGCRVVIPRANPREGKRRDVWLLDSAILLRSDTTLELDHCRLKLSDRCRDNFMRSANCGLGITEIEPMENIHVRGVGRVLLEGADHPRATGDSGKKIGGRTYGTDAGKAEESQTGDWRNIGILLAYVQGFSIENLTIKDSHAWAISLERCAHGRLRDLTFASKEFRVIDGTRETILNQDGIDLRMGCHDILIENITGHTGDDLIALTAIPNADSVAGGTASTMVSAGADRGEGRDDIRHVILRNIKGFSRGGHHIVRLLNTSGVRLHDILVDGLIDTSPKGLRCKAAIKIGDHAYGGGVAPLGDTTRIMINNVMSKARHTVLVGGSLSDSMLTNIVRYGSKGEVLSVASGPEYIQDVTITAAHTMSEGAQ
ncbi:MAG: glycosyl hydrolase family 28 protein [Planctomycetota bacterium]